MKMRWLTIAAVLLTTAGLAGAATWDGGGADNNWGTAANWDDTGNGVWDPGEAYTDDDPNNGQYDAGEDFTDLPDGVDDLPVSGDSPTIPDGSGFVVDVTGTQPGSGEFFKGTFGADVTVNIKPGGKLVQGGSKFRMEGTLKVMGGTCDMGGIELRSQGMVWVLDGGTMNGGIREAYNSTENIFRIEGDDNAVEIDKLTLGSRSGRGGTIEWIADDTTDAITTINVTSNSLWKADADARVLVDFSARDALGLAEGETFTLLSVPDAGDLGVVFDSVTVLDPDGNELTMGSDYTLTYDTIDDDNGTDGDVILTIVPEPATLAILGVGAVGVLLRRRRR